ncbi:E3 ubiquitin-protein ligase RNF146 isoform X3 [Osmia bicornis bicornis]|uniref:E3 ubiquitin-protein ligase RNF146 isoform X3 n=1 Tax=Osmia bicornis bicornis TaxID=1437191 RepID=UPI0010F7AB77|nr:E3 ubiquitin-protein ligase RNF146 isoform X3 [Osmia bicornis bicornis]
MAQAKVNSQEETSGTLNDKEKESDEKEGTTTILECAVCLQPCIYPARLPCNHIYCYLCVKGVANQSKRCPMCRQEIPPDFLNRPQLVEVDEAQKESEHFEEEYQWFYEGRNGWWQYDQRTSHELETAYKQGKRNCELLIAGFLYIADFGSMLQLRRNDPSRRRKIKRDLYNVPKKGVAGLRLNHQDEEIIREVRGAERPASPASDDMGIMFSTGDGTNTPVPPSNTPQTPAGGTASGDATPLNDRMEQRDSLHQVLEQMRSLVLREHLSSDTDDELDEDEETSTHPTL